jgi:hypothetical protein
MSSPGANHNPARIGYPPRDTLIALGRRELPIEAPVAERLAECSPCYQEFRASERALQVQDRAPISKGYFG